MWKKLVYKLRLSRIAASLREQLQIVVPTKNSARWIGTIIDAYRRLGLEPFLLLDGFSQDGTERVLGHKRVEYAKVFPELPRVEAIIQCIPEYTKAKWVLRLDDDEFPSHALVSWLSEELGGLPSDVAGIPRRWVRLGQQDRCEYSNHRLLRWYQDRMDIQWRLFRPKKVEYIKDIHTPGFRVPPNCPVAPDTAFIVHFDWVIRSPDARARKLDDYDRQAPDAGSKFRELYLWESSDIQGHQFRRMEDREFDRLARTLARAEDCRRRHWRAAALKPRKSLCPWRISAAGNGIPARDECSPGVTSDRRRPP